MQRRGYPIMMAARMARTPDQAAIGSSSYPSPPPALLFSLSSSSPIPTREKPLLSPPISPDSWLCCEITLALPFTPPPCPSQAPRPCSFIIIANSLSPFFTLGFVKEPLGTCVEKVRHKAQVSPSSSYDFNVSVLQNKYLSSLKMNRMLRKHTHTHKEIPLLPQ